MKYPLIHFLRAMGFFFVFSVKVLGEVELFELVANGGPSLQEQTPRNFAIRRKLFDDHELLRVLPEVLEHARQSCHRFDLVDEGMRVVRMFVLLKNLIQVYLFQ